VADFLSFVYYKLACLPAYRNQRPNNEKGGGVGCIPP